MDTIYLIEDDPKLQHLLKEFLEKYHYTVFCVNDFIDIGEEFKSINPDLVLLDINLPYYDGFYVCRTLRKQSDLPILIISARNGDYEQIMGMELGADDYMIKPINFEVLLAKIKSQLRRYKGELSTTAVISLHGLSLDESFFKMSYENKSVELSKNEFKLIKKLVSSHNRYVTREELLEALWDDQVFVDENTLTVNVSRVKQRLKDVGLVDVIKTKRGVGYQLTLIGDEDE